MNYKYNSNEYFMHFAIEQAQIALEKDEVPVGAVIVIDNKIIAKAHNLTESLNDPTAHAEILAITSANQYLGAKYLPNASLYVTVEPCLMCAGAIFWSKISNLFFGAYDSKNGMCKIQNNLKNNISITHPKLNIVGNILDNECSSLMKIFFAKKRQF